MKIVLATPIYPPDIGGPATYAQRLRQGLESRSMAVDVVSYAKLKKIPQPLRMIFYFAKLLKTSLAADIIYAFNIISCGVPAYFCARIFRKKFFMRIGGDFLWERAVEQGRTQETLREYYANPAKTTKEKIMIFFMGQILKNADTIIFTSDFQRQIYLKYFKFSAERTFVIANPFPEPRQMAIQESPGNYQFLYAGRLLKLKNLEFLVKAFYNVLSKTDKNITLKIIGDGPEKARLAKYEKIIFSPPMPHAELMREISRSYVCVLPSLTEITPNFALECLAMSKPILLTKEMGLRDLGDKLILIDPKNLADLQNKILYLLDENNYTDYLEKIKNIPMAHSWDDIIKEHEKSFISRSN